jgi:hypothetical protein
LIEIKKFESLILFRRMAYLKNLDKYCEFVTLG